MDVPNREKKDPNWPAWFYGPGDQSKIFDREEDVPAGWKDHPSKVSGSKPEAAAGEAPREGARPPAPISPSGDASGAEHDSDGHAWDPALHSATKSKTQTGLWRMKVGVTRPAPAPGFPKPAQSLDL